MSRLNRKAWEKECISLANQISPEEFFRKSVDMANSRDIYDYERSSIYEYSFFGACLAGQKEHAKIILDECITGKQKLDIGMGNYLILSSGDLDALKAYSSLVDMNSPQGTDEGWCHIHLLAIYDHVDMLNYCHEIGYASDEGYTHFDFVRIMVKNNHFESAKSYAEQHNSNPSFESWNNAIHNLARNHEGRKIKSPVDRFECLKEIYPGYDICSTDPHKAIHKALGNCAIDVAQYFIDNGAPKHLLTSTQSVESIFSQDYGYAYVYSEAINWLLDLDVAFSTDQIQRILLDQAHRKDGEATVEKLVGLIDDKDVPWEEMLINSCGTSKEDVVKRMKHLTSLHSYQKEDYENAISRVVGGWGSLKLIKHIQARFEVGYNQSALTAFTSLNSSTNNRTDILMDILKSNSVDIACNDNEAIVNEVKSIVSRGGRVDNIQVLLENGADIMAQNGKAYKRIKDYCDTHYRDDLVSLANQYLSVENKIYRRGQEPSLN